MRGSSLVSEDEHVKVFVNCTVLCSGDHRDILPEEFPVPECHPS